MEGCGCLFLLLILWGLYSIAADFFSFFRQKGIWMFAALIAVVVARRLYQKLNDTSNAPSYDDSLKVKMEVGHKEYSSEREKEISELASSPLFLVAAALAKFAKCDGVITQNEISTVEAIFSEFGIVGEDRRDAIRIFTKHKNGVLSYEESLKLLKNSSEFDGQFFFDFCIRLFRLAHADSQPSRYSIQNVQQACAVFGIDYDDVKDCFRGENQCQSNDADYEILGVSTNDSDDIIKKRYRELTKTFHPDTLAGQGVSTAITELAAAKFREIQTAYERVMSKRNRL
jgi:DnaJ like chaperone protein